MAEEECLSPQDFGILKDLRTKNAFIASRAEKAILESKIAELEYKTAILNAYVKYGLNMADSIDEVTGKVIRAEKTFDENQTDEEKDQK